RTAKRRSHDLSSHFVAARERALPDAKRRQGSSVHGGVLSARAARRSLCTGACATWWRAARLRSAAWFASRRAWLGRPVRVGARRPRLGRQRNDGHILVAEPDSLAGSCTCGSRRRTTGACLLAGIPPGKDGAYRGGARDQARPVLASGGR